MLSVEFVGEEVPLEETEIEKTDESGVSRGVSRKIRKIKSDSAGKAGSGIGEDTRESNWPLLYTMAELEAAVNPLVPVMVLTDVLSRVC